MLRPNKIASAVPERVFGLAGRPALVAGVDWNSPDDNQKFTPARIRDAAVRAKDATHYILFKPAKKPSEPILGLFGLTIQDEGSADYKLPRKFYSAAAMFAKLVGAEHPRAALALRIDNGLAGSDVTRYLIVKLQDGVPNLDKVFDKGDEAIKALGQATEIFTDSSLSLTADSVVDHVDLKWLYQALQRDMALIPVPMNLTPIITLGSFLVFIFIIRYFYLDSVEKKAAVQAREMAMRNDPAIQYAKQLEAGLPAFLTDRAAIERLMDRIDSMRPVLQGWALQSVSCKLMAPDPKCMATWRSMGGQFQDLLPQLPGHDLVISSQGDGVQGAAAGRSKLVTPNSLDVATTVFPIEIATVSAASARTQFPNAAQLIDVWSALQAWQLTNFTTSTQTLTQWPTLQGVSAANPLPGSLRRATIKVSRIPSAFVRDFLRETPAGVYWSALQLTVALDAPPETRLMFEFEGSLFARDAQAALRTLPAAPNAVGASQPAAASVAMPSASVARQ